MVCRVGTRRGSFARFLLWKQDRIEESAHERHHDIGFHKQIVSVSVNQAHRPAQIFQFRSILREQWSDCEQMVALRTQG